MLTWISSSRTFSNYSENCCFGRGYRVNRLKIFTVLAGRIEVSKLGVTLDAVFKSGTIRLSPIYYSAISLPTVALPDLRFVTKCLQVSGIDRRWRLQSNNETLSSSLNGIYYCSDLISPGND